MHAWLQHEMEAHDLQIFHLCLQYQGAATVGAGEFGVPQFGDSNMLGGVTGSGIANLGEGFFCPSMANCMA